MSNRRDFAIGDIHGCLKTFKALLYQKIELQKTDRVYLLGDYVHRGPDSLGVLDEIIHLMEKGYDIRPIKGNHDVMFLEEELLLAEKHRRFLSTLPYFRESNDFYFVHAALDFALDDPLAGHSAMLWGTGIPVEVDLEFLQHRKVVHGHKIHSLSSIFDAIYDGEPIIPLDNGCYKGLEQVNEGYGNLCALDLDEMRLLVQENVDG